MTQNTSFMYQCSTVQKSEDQRSRHAKKATHKGAFFPIESAIIKDFQTVDEK